MPHLDLISVWTLISDWTLNNSPSHGSDLGQGLPELQCHSSLALVTGQVKIFTLFRKYFIVYKRPWIASFTDNKPVWLCLTICRRCTQKDINGLWSIVSGSLPVPGCDWALPLVPVINLGCGWPHTFHICVKITLMCSKRLRRVAQPSAWPQPAQLVRVGSGHECCHTHIQCFTHITLHTKPSAHTAPSSLRGATRPSC